MKEEFKFILKECKLKVYNIFKTREIFRILFYIFLLTFFALIIIGGITNLYCEMIRPLDIENCEQEILINYLKVKDVEYIVKRTMRFNSLMTFGMLFIIKRSKKEYQSLCVVLFSSIIISIVFKLMINAAR